MMKEKGRDYKGEKHEQPVVVEHEHNEAGELKADIGRTCAQVADTLSALEKLSEVNPATLADLQTEFSKLQSEVQAAQAETEKSESVEQKIGALQERTVQDVRRLQKTLFGVGLETDDDERVAEALSAIRKAEEELAALSPDASMGEVNAIIERAAARAVSDKSLERANSRAYGAYQERYIRQNAAKEVIALEDAWLRKYAFAPDEPVALETIAEAAQTDPELQPLLQAVIDAADGPGMMQGWEKESTSFSQTHEWQKRFYEIAADKMFAVTMLEAANIGPMDLQVATKYIETTAKALGDTKGRAGVKKWESQKVVTDVLKELPKRAAETDGARFLRASGKLLELRQRVGGIEFDTAFDYLVKDTPVNTLQLSETLERVEAILENPIADDKDGRWLFLGHPDVFMRADQATFDALMAEIAQGDVSASQEQMTTIERMGGNSSETIRVIREVMQREPRDKELENSLAALEYRFKNANLSSEQRAQLISDLSNIGPKGRSNIYDLCYDANVIPGLHEAIIDGRVEDPEIAEFYRENSVLTGIPADARRAMFAFARQIKGVANKRAALISFVGSAKTQMGWDADRMNGTMPAVLEVVTHPAFADARFAYSRASNTVVDFSPEGRNKILENVDAIGRAVPADRDFANIILGHKTSEASMLVASESLRKMADPQLFSDREFTDYLLSHEDLLEDGEYCSLLQQLPDTDKAFFAEELAHHNDREGCLDAIRLVGEKKRYEMVKDIIPELVALLPERQRKFLDITERIADSPSQAMQRVRKELAVALLAVENPDVAFASIEKVFVKNNLPDVAKTLRVFEILNSKEELDKKLSNEKLSPILRDQKYRGRMVTLYKDMMKVHLDSNNPSLRLYLETLQGAEPTITKVESGEVLSAQEEQAFTQFCAKLEVLHENSQLGVADTPSLTLTDAREVYASWKQDLGVKKDQTVNERVAEMFLKPLGISNFESAIARMEQGKKDADVRGRDLARRLLLGEQVIRAGDLLKGIDDKYFRTTLRNGSVAKEFLGSGADSDLTPLDTDLGQVLASDAEQGTAGALDASPVNGYGDVVLGFRDRGKFVRTDEGGIMETGAKPTVDDVKYELFRTGIVDQERHVGIRTGIASTEIDFILLKDAVRSQDKFRSLAMDIVSRGVYVPLVDRDGTLLFTPEDFDTYRDKYLSGLKDMDGPAFALEDAREKGNSEFTERLEMLKQEKQKDKESIPRQTEEIRAVVTKIFQKRGVSWRDKALSLAGAEMHDTGSSGRLTNVPGSYDFDFILKLDPKDMREVAAIQREVAAELQAFGGTAHEADTEGQLRMLGVKFPGSETGVDIDIGFISKSEVEEFEAHDAVRERFAAIKKEYGEAAVEDVLANITLAKQMLKDASAYKKGSHGDGGLGGIGVENWVLAHGGSVLAACEAFTKNAFDENGSMRTLDEMRQRYAIVDPGINVKYGGHDDFMRNLTPEGYDKMVKASKVFLEQSLT